MKGIARTVLQLVYGSGLQRWLLRIGLALTVLGFSALISGWHPAAQPLFVFIGMFGAAIAVISPVVVGAIVFRALSAPRSVRLIAHGRLKLVSGAFTTQLLLAAFIAGSVTMALRSAPGPHASLSGTTTGVGYMGVVFAYAFSTSTLIFFTFYLSMQSRFGALVWVAYVFVPPLLSHAFPQLHLGALLGAPRGLATVLTVSVLVWPLFAVGYIRQRQINLPNWRLVGPDSSPLYRYSAPATQSRAVARYSRQQAIRILLTGIVSVQRQVIFVLIVSLAFLAAMLATTRANVPDRSAFIWAFFICLFAGVVPAAKTGLMTQRARSLWLTARMGREELFAAVELQAWRTLLSVAGTAMALTIPLLALSKHGAPDPAQLVSLLAVPLTVGASGIYVSLFLVRGFRLPDNLFLAGYTVLLMVETFIAVSASPTPTLPSLLAGNIIALPLVRQIAQRRWQNIDWPLHRRSVAQLTG